MTKDSINFFFMYKEILLFIFSLKKYFLIKILTKELLDKSKV